MKIWIKGSLSLIAFLLSLYSSYSYSYIPYIPPSGNVPDWMQRELKQLHENESRLEQEVSTLKGQLRGQKGAQPTQSMPSSLPPPGKKSQTWNYEREHLQSAAHEHQETPAEESVFLGEGPYGYYSAERFRKGITVTTSPLLGLRTAFDASDLLYQYPVMNQDLILLRQRSYFQEHLAYIGDSLDNRAIIVISGGLQGEVIYDREFTGQSNGDVNLSTMELDIMPLMSDWANGLVALNFDSSQAATGTRVENSRIYLSRGFLTVGNLEVAPVYVTIGQMYLPFGRYSTAMLTTPLTESIGRIQDRAALLGYFKDGFYGELFGNQGSRTAGVDFTFKQGGLNLGYQTNSIDIGAGYVTNLADSQGMQNNGLAPLETDFEIPSGIAITGLNEFGGFGETPGGGNFLDHNVPAADVHMEFNYGPWSMISEFITQLRQFSTSDMTFNNSPANVSAMHLESDFTLHANGKPIVLAIVYDQSWQALALNLPKNSYAGIISTSIWKNTTFGIEYRHDINYGVQGPNATMGSDIPVPSANIGGTRNLVTIALGAYF